MASFFYVSPHMIAIHREQKRSNYLEITVHFVVYTPQMPQFYKERFLFRELGARFLQQKSGK